jgi:GNAT superfamily N-acetyltransferase
MTLRQLAAGDEALLEEFLRAHADSSMFLRSNLRRAGIAYEGERYQATYAAAFRDGRVIGAAAHCWNGMVLLQAPEQTADVAQACVAWSGRPITGLAGPAEQVHRARVALHLENAATAMDSDEERYALDLSAIIVPPALSGGTVTWRAPHSGERDTLCAWRMAYDIEVSGATDSPESRHRSATALDAQIADGNAWVATQDGVPVSLSAFNATLPDIVQLGGIYTPPELRGRGFAKIAVAASLIAARDRGVSRAVLFTDNPSAVRTYEAVGFRRGGDYSLVLLK